MCGLSRLFVLAVLFLTASLLGSCASEGSRDEGRLLASSNSAQFSANLKLAAAVAEWGMLLRNSAFKGNASFDEVLVLARDAQGRDAHGYRAEFITLVEMSKGLDRGR